MKKMMMLAIALSCATVFVGCGKKDRVPLEEKHGSESGTKKPQSESGVKNSQSVQAEIDKQINEFAQEFTQKVRKSAAGQLSETDIQQQVKKVIDDIRSTVMKAPEDKRLERLRMALKDARLAL